MWFGLPDESHADDTITQLAAEEHQTDWGMRIISGSRRSMTDPAITLDPCGRCLPGGRRWPNTATIARFRLIPIFERTPCSGSMARLATSRKCCPGIITNRLRRVLRIRSGRRPWSSARFYAGCLACRSMPKSTRSRWRPHVPADWTVVRNSQCARGQYRSGFSIPQNAGYASC